VVHFDATTSARDLHEGVKRRPIANQSEFHERWRHALANHEEMGVRADLEKDRGRRARVLIIDAYLPVSDQDSGLV